MPTIGNKSFYSIILLPNISTILKSVSPIKVTPFFFPDVKRTQYARSVTSLKAFLPYVALQRGVLRSFYAHAADQQKHSASFQFLIPQ